MRLYESSMNIIRAVFKNAPNMSHKDFPQSKLFGPMPRNSVGSPKLSSMRPGRLWPLPTVREQEDSLPN